MFTRRVLIDSVSPVFHFASSNSFIFHILFSFLICSSENSWRCIIRTCVVVFALCCIYLQLVQSLDSNFCGIWNRIILIQYYFCFSSSVSLLLPSTLLSSLPPNYVNFCISTMKIGHSSLEAPTHWICFDIPSFITCLYKYKSYIWQPLSVVYLVFFCLVVCLILVWVIFVSVVWIYVS